MKVCECCGHPLPEMEVLLDLTRMQAKLFVLIQRSGQAGITADALKERLYVNEDDTPDSLNILHVMKQGMQPRLQKHGLKIAVRRGPGALWRLESIRVV
jgi:hypothetical protein